MAWDKQLIVPALKLIHFWLFAYILREQGHDIFGGRPPRQATLDTPLVVGLPLLEFKTYARYLEITPFSFLWVRVNSSVITVKKESNLEYVVG